MPTQPNILWICSDQQRYDTISALGNSLIRTPNIDQLAERGVTFTQTYCQSPVCTPSRASFLTGRYPRTTRCRQNGQTIPADERLLPRMLRDHGYRSGLSGKLHLSSCSGGKVEQRIDDGYDVFHWSHHPDPDWEANDYQRWLREKGVAWKDIYPSREERDTSSDPRTGEPYGPYVWPGVPEEFHQTTWCAEMAIEFIKENAGRPWLFSVNMFDPHHPFDPPAEYLHRYRPDQMPLPKYRPGELDNKPRYQQLDHEWAHNDVGGMHVATLSPREQQKITAAYYAMVELIDTQVGRMVDALEQTGQLENTIVIFMSDHGEMLGDHGLYLKGPHFYEQAVHVPLIISWPQQFQADTRCEELVELVDLAPTLLESCSIEIEPQIQGRSLIRQLRGEQSAGPHREDVYCEYYNSWTHPRSYGTMLRTRDHKLVVYHGTEPGELYDLNADPDEFDNLWDRPEHQETKIRLMQRLFDRSVFTMDPCPPRLGPF